MEYINGQDYENLHILEKLHITKEANKIYADINDKLRIKIFSGHSLKPRNIIKDNKNNCIKLIDFAS